MGTVIPFRKKDTQPQRATADTGTDFAEVERRNRENAERIRRERLQDTQQVLKDYRIKKRGQ